MTKGKLMIYFTSDLHIDHIRLLKFGYHPFECSAKGCAQSNEFIRQHYTATVKPEDFVFFLGDLAFCNSQNKDRIKQFIRSLPGHKVLIKGNHDRNNTCFYLDCGFLSVVKGLKFGDYYLCHFSLTADDVYDHEHHTYVQHFKESHCSTLIHGHVHSHAVTAEDGIRRINVCVDYPPNHFSPVRIDGFPEDEVEHYFKTLLSGKTCS